MAETLVSKEHAAFLPGGITLRDDGNFDFGDRAAEALAALGGSIVAPLPGLAVIRASGADAETFLQGQLGNDVRATRADLAQPTSYSSPKGRAYAVIELLRRPDGFWLLLPADVAPAVLKRLRMFVLRAKLTLAEAGGELAALGLAGAETPALLAALGLPAPAEPWACADADGLCVLRHPGAAPRFRLIGTPAQLEALWPRLAAGARPVGPLAFRLLELRDGLPAIHAETSEQHVPQMLNLDQLGGISFTKGCYPGQEIVARLHYLGNLKRRLFVGHSDALPPRGQPIYAEAEPAQPVGEVLDACPAGPGAAVQAVLTLAAAEAGGLRLGSADGPPLQLDFKNRD